MAACKMISFNDQYKNLSLQKHFLTENILFELCLYFFIKLFRGEGGGGGSLSIEAWERCFKFSISIPIISEFVCALV